jgi:hypothetical protein
MPKMMSPRSTPGSASSLKRCSPSYSGSNISLKGSGASYGQCGALYRIHRKNGSPSCPLPRSQATALSVA